MRTLAAAVFLGIQASLFCGRLQRRLRRWFTEQPLRIFVIPVLLAGFFCALLAADGGLTWKFALLLAAYALAPAALAYWGVSGRRREGWADLWTVLLLWLPVEFTLGRELLPSGIHGLANELGQGTAFALALLLLVVCRGWNDAKYNLPRRTWDLVWIGMGLAVAVALLGPLARVLDFVGPLGLPAEWSALGFLRLFLITLAGVGIPEELLFRSLIQNWLVRHLRDSHRGLLAAAVVFGAAHLNNAPGPLPNWRYMILASIAGVIYGKVFQQSSSVLASACLHALVNCLRRVFFA